MSDSLVTDNLTLIEQGVSLLARLPPDVFVARAPATLGASIGGHLRHNIDHYTCFVRGIPHGRIDYDARERVAEIESDPNVAAEALRHAAEEFLAIPDAALDRAVEVRMDTGEGDERPWTNSSVRRELQFLLSHTVHHYALIAMVCRQYGVDVEENFGVAPSTLKFRRQTAQVCAR
jgi:uncharacterized damage-inducible protein DinB